LIFERLDPSRHDRESFSCGEDSLDSYLKRQASQDVRRRLAACFVLCPEPGAREILGYYTLSPLSIESKDLAESTRARLAGYAMLPAILLGRLAAASAYQRGQKMGQRLLADAVNRARSAEITGMAVVVDALNENAAGFYLHFGFTRFEDVPSRLYLPLGNLRRSS